MKKLVSFACTVAALSGISFAAQAQDLRITLQLPEKHHLGVNLNDWKSCVMEKTSDFNIQIFPSAQLFKDNEVPLAVGSGAIEMGTASLTRFAGSVPAVDAVYVPFLLDSEEKLKKATAPGSEIRKILDDAIVKETGVRILWWQAFGRTIYLSNNKPLRTPDDVKGMKVRTFGKLLGWTVEALGGAPTIMSGSKQFLAYQTGAVDAGITGMTAVKSRKLYEVMDNMTLTYDSDIEFVATINEELFQSFSSEQQQILQSCGEKVEKSLRDSIFAKEAAALDAVKDKINVVELTAEERAKWRAATKPVVERFVKEGGDVAAKVIAAAEKL